MSLLSLLGPRPPVLKGDRVTLRPPRLRDHSEWARLRGSSRGFLEPWEPSWAWDELERPAWRQRLARYRRDYAQGTGMTYFVVENEGGRITGGISMGNIRRGVSQSAQIGYWMGEQHAGKGYMGAAIAMLLDHAFVAMRLNRIEAACIPRNERSIRVLEKAGFRREGLLRSYLRINGTWQDHFLYAITADEYARARRG
jgi:[ribosomal protein S5]-alanine N-acetyltransferase